MTAAPNWDPQPQDRLYYREKMTGRVGFLVRREGVDVVRLEGIEPEQTKPLDYQWEPARKFRSLRKPNVAQIAFEADRCLCRFIQRHEHVHRKWHELSEAQRERWLERGPKDHPLRAKLFKAIQEALREEAE